MPRPARQTLLVDAVGRVPEPDVVQGPIADHMRELRDDIGIVLFVAVRGRGMVGGTGAERLE